VNSEDDVALELDWGDFKLILALSRGGSVAGAGRLLGVDSSTISRRLGAMEQAIGACLVLRGGRDFSFTAEGMTAVSAAEAMEKIVFSTTSSIHAAKTEIEGTVRISSVPSMVRLLMPLPLIVAQKHPKLSIELNAVTRMIDFAKGEADIAIRMVRPTEIDLIAKRALELGAAVYASKTYAARRRLPSSFAELSQHPLIQYVEPLLRVPMYRWMEDYADKYAPATRVDGAEMAFSLVASGAGLSVLNCYAGDSSPDLIRVFPDPVASATGWIVYHEAARNSARIRAVTEILTEFFAERAALLAGRSASV
jgi:DNA-binding transcriptional LysR family regulator